MSHPVFVDNGLGNTFEIHESARIDPSVKFVINGGGHVIRVGENAVIRNSHIDISGEGNTLDIGANCNLRGSFHLRQSCSALKIGPRTTSVGAHWFAMEGKTVMLGEDCMISSGVFIRTSDEHPIYDLETGDRLNGPQDVNIGAHVWLGEGVVVSKGASIPDGCVIGAKSYVSKKLSRKNSVYAGTPARLVRESVRWDRRLPIVTGE